MRTKMFGKRTTKAMKKFKCPLCKDDPPIERGSDEHLDMAIAAHILHHEEVAIPRSVDRARLQCPSTICEIGRKNHQNLSIGNPALNLSDWDRTWLSAIKIAS